MSGYIVICASCNDDDTSEVVASVISIDEDNTNIAKVFPSVREAITAMVDYCETVVKYYIDEAVKDYDGDEMPEADTIACWGFGTNLASNGENKRKAWISIHDASTFFDINIIALG